MYSKFRIPFNTLAHGRPVKPGDWTKSVTCTFRVRIRTVTLTLNLQLRRRRTGGRPAAK